MRKGQSRASPELRGRLISKSYNFLVNNFHKFKLHHKIQVALELVKKDIPDKIEGDREVIIVLNNPKPEQKPELGQHSGSRVHGDRTLLAETSQSE